MGYANLQLRAVSPGENSKGAHRAVGALGPLTLTLEPLGEQSPDANGSYGQQTQRSERAP